VNNLVEGDLIFGTIAALIVIAIRIREESKFMILARMSARPLIQVAFTSNISTARHSLMSTLAGLMQLKWPGPSMHRLTQAAFGLVRRHPRLFVPGQTLEGSRCSSRLPADMTSTDPKEA
jgi:hypothetical protein